MKKVTLTALIITLALAGTAEAKQVKKSHKNARVAPVVQPVNDNDRYQVAVGDPRIVYHEIGTSGAQKGNTILPFYNEPIRSTRPYEIRYDYHEMR